jgi:hypothetical protein
MLGKRILIGTLSSLIIVFAIQGCGSKKQIISPSSPEKEDVEEVVKEDGLNKVEGNVINATLNCSGSSVISLLQLSAKKYATEDFQCNVSREQGLKVQFTSESKNMEILFKIHNIETSMIEKGIYQCKSKNSEHYLEVSLNAKSLGQHNFGDVFEGTIEIIDYGMSSDVICGKFSVIDRKGNKIEGNFNETISMF